MLNNQEPDHKGWQPNSHWHAGPVSKQTVMMHGDGPRLISNAVSIPPSAITLGGLP